VIIMKTVLKISLISLALIALWGIARAGAQLLIQQPTQAGSLQIKRVGTDLTVFTAPVGRISYDEIQPISVPQYIFTELRPGHYAVKSSVAYPYKVSMAMCQYRVGEIPCRITDVAKYKSLTATSTDGFYSVDAAIASGTITKVVFKYDNVGGDIVVKRVGVNNYPFTATTTVATLVNATSSEERFNPGFFQDLDSTSHTVSVTDLPDYTESAGTCTYDRGGNCQVFSYLLKPVCDGKSCLASTTVQTGKVTKVVFKYTKSNNTAIQLTPSLKIYFVGVDLSTSTAPADVSAAVMAIPSQKSITALGKNPELYAFPQTGVLGFAATNTPVVGHQVSGVGICQYSGSSTDCIPTTFSVASCTNDICTVFLPYISGVVQKIVYKYDTTATTSKLVP
jgi:hypothetical protein